MTMSNRTELAMKYLSYGWSVIPVHVPVNGGCSCGDDDCSWPGKHPRVRWVEYTKRRPKRSEVRQWFDEDFYGSNLGVVTGLVSNLVVLDVDGDLRNYRNLGLPPTLTAVSGGGGRHFFFRCDTMVQSRPSTAFVEGIDLKAEGGFIVLPPSVHKSGSRYRWRRRMQPAVLDPSKLPAPTRTASLNSHDEGWYDELIGGVDKGNRSNASARLAGRYVRKGLSVKEISLLLGTWNTLNNPPLSTTELGGTIRRAYERIDREEQVRTRRDIAKLLGMG